MPHDDTHHSGFRWYTIPAAITFGLGLTSLAMALYATAVMAYVVFVQRHYNHVAQMLAGCFMYWAAGIALVVAGVSFWREKLRAALIAAAVGVLIPVVLFAVLGFE